VAEGITLYDVLGVSAGASADTLRRASEERARQLRPSLVSGAPSPVVIAARRAREAAEFAGLVLCDPELRRRYDQEIGLRRERGLPAPREFGPREFGPGTLQGGDPYGPLRVGARLLPMAILASFEALLGWMAPRPAPPPRRVTVPDVRGLFFKPCQAVAAHAGLRLDVVRLTASPMAVEGLVTGQSPTPGASARRHSALRVQVWHPPNNRVGR
jgi:hypothetical protein